jgi:hypothetical protein
MIRRVGWLGGELADAADLKSVKYDTDHDDAEGEEVR